MPEEPLKHPARTPLTGREIADEELHRWANVLGGLQTRVRTPDFASALALVVAIGEVAERQDHHPDLDLRYGRVDVRTHSHDVGAVTSRDIRLARAISTLVADVGLELEVSTVSPVKWALDSPQLAAVKPFWAAVLSMRDGGDDGIRDADGVTTPVWFQSSGDEEPRQHWHPDVWVDPAQVQPRIDAAVAAGGVLVSDQDAPRFWVLADPDGNRVCLCTWQDRDTR